MKPVECKPKTSSVHTRTKHNKTAIFIVCPQCVSEVKVAQLCLTLCDPMDCTVHGIL